MFKNKIKNKNSEKFNKKTKKMLLIVLVFCFTAHLCIFPVRADTNNISNINNIRNISNFRDISPNDWYYVYVERLYSGGLINGISESSYAPDAQVKTSEVAAMITRYLGLEHIAERNRETLISMGTEGADAWYSGYIQVLYDAGILDSDYLAHYSVQIVENDKTAISPVSAVSIDSPIRRMDMVKLIAKSFEIKGGKVKSGKLGGTGSEFINGGGYDRELLESISGRIADYNNIPQDYQIYFAKCYYNGIVRGNESGSVLPFDYLRRSELAKIIATVMYFDLRGEDMRSLPAACVITPGDYVVSSANGTRVLKNEKAEQILREQAKNISTSISGYSVDSVNIEIARNNIIPRGFIDEIYIYSYDSIDNNISVSEVGRMTSSSSNNSNNSNNSNTIEYFPKNGSFSVPKSKSTADNAFAGYIYLVLRDLTRGGEIAGAVMLNVDNSGNLKDSLVYYLP